MKRILAAIDHSAPSLRGARLAADIAAKFEAELVLVTVAQQLDVPVPELEDYRRIEHVSEPLGVIVANGAQVELERLRDRLAADHKFQILTDVLVGQPAEQITSYAQRSAVDLIVLGHVGHSRLANLLIGSVAKRVVEAVSCPVLIVH